MDANSTAQFAVPMLPNFGGGGNSVINRGLMPMASTSSSSVNFAVPNGSAAQQQQQQQAGIIRRRRYSTAKIQPTRIKKVMQSDEEIGRMVQSVPVSIGRAMEHFAEKFLQATADATQFTNSKTLTPQHMKQAMICNPHFSFLETVLKDITVPQGIAEIAMSRVMASHTNLQEHQNNDIANAILANAQLTLQQPYEPPQTNGNGVYPVQEVPLTPTTQLANEMMDMLKNGIPLQHTQITGLSQKIQNGVKRSSVDANGEDDKRKRGRPKKKKTEKDRCVDDDLYEEASRNVAKEDKDRELMPPPSLPGFLSS